MLFLSYYINKRACIAQLVDKDSGKHWDLGSIPRSPTFFNYIFSNIPYALWSTMHL